MPHDADRSRTVIPVDHIRETVTPPYEYQKPQNGFGSASFDPSRHFDQESKQSKSKVGK